MDQDLIYRKDGAIYRLRIEGLLMLEASENYVKCFLDGEIAMVRTTFQNLLAKLPPGVFIQISRIQAVRISEIYKFTKEELYLIGRPDHPLGVGKQYYEAMLEQLVMLE